MEKEIARQIENITGLIHYFRGEKVILDFDLAKLYGMEVKRLKESVRRNLKRFPSDFLFELTRDEFISLRSQIATLKRGQHSKFLPFAFTEQGVAMLSSVLNSDTAIQVNISIMRAFVHFRRFLDTHKELARKIENLEKTISSHDEKNQLIFSAINQLIEKEEELPKERKPVGYRQ